MNAQFQHDVAVRVLEKLAEAATKIPTKTPPKFKPKGNNFEDDFKAFQASGGKGPWQPEGGVEKNAMDIKKILAGMAAAGTFATAPIATEIGAQSVMHSAKPTISQNVQTIRQKGDAMSMARAKDPKFEYMNQLQAYGEKQKPHSVGKNTASAVSEALE